MYVCMYVCLGGGDEDDKCGGYRQGDRGGGPSIINLSHVARAGQGQGVGVRGRGFGKEGARGQGVSQGSRQKQNETRKDDTYKEKETIVVCAILSLL